jgi:tetratricopeptide (TPR) repeat protein
VLFFVTSRYRMPVAPVLIVLASGGVARILSLARERALLRLVPALLFLVAAYPFVFHDFLRDDLWTSHHNMGFVHAKNAERKRREADRLVRMGFDDRAREARLEAETSMDLAEESYRRGLAARPKLGHLRRALRDLLTTRVTVLVEAKDPRAVARAEELTAAYPRSADAWALLGSAHAAAGRETEARGALERALGLAPDNLRALRELARFDSSAAPR